MATDRYDPLKIPSLHDYPFISAAFSRTIAEFKNADGQMISTDVSGERRLKDRNFNGHGTVKHEQMAPIHGMTDQTFESLFGLLKPSVKGKLIRSKTDLETLAAIELKDDLATLDQMASYLLFGANLSPNIQWAKVAHLFNESTNDQKEAIYHYFGEYKNRVLSWLFELNPKITELPESLQESFESKEQDGVTYLYSESLQKWLRDDRFHQQYRVDIVITRMNAITLAATAPTLAQAIAKATLYVLDGEYELDCYHCTIRQSGLPVAHAEFHSLNSDHDKIIDYAERPIKLIWQADNLGFGQQYIDNMINKGTTQAQMNAMLQNYAPVTEKTFIKTLFAVEKALGVTWNKVARLEDELGL